MKLKVDSKIKIPIIASIAIFIAIYSTYLTHLAFQTESLQGEGYFFSATYNYSLSFTVFTITITLAYLTYFYFRLISLNSLFLKINKIMKKKSFWYQLSTLLLKINAIILPLAIIQFYYKLDLFNENIQTFITVIFILQIILTAIVYNLARLELIEKISQNIEKIEENI